MHEYISPEIQIAVTLGIGVVNGTLAYVCCRILNGYETASNYFWLAAVNGDTPGESYSFVREMQSREGYFERLGIRMTCRKFRNEQERKGVLV